MPQHRDLGTILAELESEGEAAKGTHKGGNADCSLNPTQFIGCERLGTLLDQGSKAIGMRGK